MMTMTGGKAAGIARWAWGDPAGRVQQAIAEVRELANAETDPAALSEIQDAGTMLSRLAGTLEPVTLAAQSIAAQVLDFGRSTAYLHEKRGAHGEWEKGSGSSIARQARSGMSPARQARLSRIQQAQVRRIAHEEAEKVAAAEKAPAPPVAAPKMMMGGMRPPAGPNKAAGIAAQIREDIKTQPPDWQHVHQEFLQQKVQPLVETKAAEVLAEATQKAQALTAQATAELVKDEEEHEKHRAVLKMATEVAIALGGAILAYVEARLGAPELAAILSSAGPFILQAIVEGWKKLLWHRNQKTGSSPSTL
jgi:hypothetical protein